MKIFPLFSPQLADTWCSTIKKAAAASVLARADYLYISLVSRLFSIIERFASYLVYKFEIFDSDFAQLVTYFLCLFQAEPLASIKTLSMIVAHSKNPDIIATEIIENGGAEESRGLLQGGVEGFSDEFQLYDRSVWTIRNRERMIKLFVNPIVSDPYVVSAAFKELQRANGGHAAKVIRSPYYSKI